MVDEDLTQEFNKQDVCRIDPASIPTNLSSGNKTDLKYLSLTEACKRL